MDVGDVGVAELVEDLKNLRRGYGVEAPDLPARLGRALRTVCAVAPNDSAAVVRRKVRHCLTELTKELPDDMAAQARKALGLDGSATVRYEERVAQLARQMGRDPRTARRRLDQVLSRLAEHALEAAPRPLPAAPKAPWHTVHLQVVVLLSAEVAEVFETRRIVAHEPGLTEIEHAMSVVRPPGSGYRVEGMDVHVIHGAAIEPPEQQGPRSLGFRLRLPKPLSEGQEHEFSLRTTLTQPFEPYYACTPRYPCDRFDLKIRFQPGRIPERIWLLDTELSMALADPWPYRKALQADRLGEVRHEFIDLEPNRSYGINWEPPAE
jgi:hypothetical protein